MNYFDEPIVAIATAAGEGAIGIIRVSGDGVIERIGNLFKSKYGKKFTKEEDKRLIYGHIVNGENIIDEVMAVAMFGPNTYTKEDMVEIQCHGGMIPLRNIMALLLDHGFRIAEPGEFTKRAFLNGRLDLAQAESVMDLISAKTNNGFDIAYNQLEGKLSMQVDLLRSELVATMAHLEVSIDYPEEDIEEITYNEVLERLNGVKNEILRLLKNSETGRIIREGLSTVIVGKPNVGKSSLLNALLKEARAIVTDIPGTTRDVIEEYIQIKGVALRLVDTAGIRETEDLVEKLGVEKSKEFFNKADLVIFVLSANEALTEDDREIMSYLKDKKAIVLVNKNDLEMVLDLNEIEKELGHMPIIRSSVLMDNGIEALEDAIVQVVYGGIKTSETALVSNVRHLNALNKALKAITDAIRVTEEGMPYDFIEVDLKNVYEHLGEITGESLEEDLVNKIFANFCLGK